MVPTVALFAHRRSPKFSTPDNQRIFEQTPFFQVLNECPAWLIDVAPPLLAMGLKLLRTERLGFLGKFFDVLGPIFGPPGWATLLLTARWPMMLLMGPVVGVTVVLGYMVAVRPRWKGAGIPLLISSGLAFLILFYNLPTIDGLGERSFPSLFSLAVPLVGAQIEWGGPLIMFAGLCLLFFAGARSSAGITSSE